MHRTCVRCHAEIPPREEHLCADIVKRLRRRERQVDAVRDVVPSLSVEQAELIVARLANLGVAD